VTEEKYGLIYHDGNDMPIPVQLSFWSRFSTLVRLSRLLKSGRRITFLCRGELATSANSDLSIPLPIPSAMTFVPAPPDAKLFSNIASACNRDLVNYYMQQIFVYCKPRPYDFAFVDSKTLYKIGRELSGKQQTVLPIKSADDSAITSEERINRWKEHFHMVLKKTDSAYQQFDGSNMFIC